ncbi:AMP-dependent synthetase [Tabrizicola sp. TH137]|uniref:AMP-binding protein n=1 Tax=Tabrizicola sp. TH137 TaxID=2067452 RepID=UPI000C7D2CFA|nr:AMP-binding protein [Tabrizicola sp. TH137]PLL12566.1 AMP-dependent synthetase [Tabrizicola sp. TH137]
MSFAALASFLSGSPEAVALVLGDGRQVSRAALAERATGFARRLGAGRKLVALEAVTCAESIAALLGAWSAGHAVALLPPGDSAAMERFRRDFAPEAVFALAGGRWRLTLDGRGAGPLHPDLALLMLTSGSTGHGKAVRLSAAAVAANAAQIAEVLEITAADRAALVLPLQYSFGLSVVTSHLAAGASVWLAEGGIRAEGFLDRAAALGVTNIQTVPMGYDLLDRAGFADVAWPGLRFLAVAGGGLAPAVQRRFAEAMAARGGRFHAMYGQTEAVARIACLPAEMAVTRAGCIGFAVPGGHLTLRDESGREEAEEGELEYRGPNVMMGYASARSDLALGSTLCALATGDVARREADGVYRIVGRKRRMSKIAGVRIGHDAVEAALAERGLRVAVFGGDQGLRVAYEGAERASDVADLAAQVAGVMRRHVDAFAVEALPRLASGKVDYPALGRVAVPEAETGVTAAFRACFHPLPVGPGDTFTGLAGDSLRHVELVLALEKALGHVPEGWEEMPVAALARMEKGAGKQGVATEIAVRAGAIVAVVVTHETLWPVYGGAAAMVVLVGLMWARFQRAAIAAGDWAALIRPMGRVLLPYYLILTGYSVAWGQVPWGSALLVSNFGIGDPVTHDRLPFLYWFVEVWVQMLLLLAGLALLPGVRRVVRENPFRAGLYALAGAMALRLWGADLLGLGGRKLFTLPWVAYLACFGWLIGCADTRRRKWIVLGLAAVVMPLVAWLGGNWYGAWLKYGCIFGVLALLLFVPRLSCPDWLRGAILPVAASSYLIYLTHRLLPEVVMAGWADVLPGWAFSALSIVGGIALGIGLTAGQRKVAAWWAARGAMRPGQGLAGTA